MVLPGLTLDQAMVVAERIRKAVEDAGLQHPTTPQGMVTISVGVYTQRLGLDQHCDDMISAADQALYRAKDSGRNRVEVFSPPAEVVPVALDLFPQA